MATSFGRTLSDALVVASRKPYVENTSCEVCGHVFGFGCELGEPHTLALRARMAAHSATWLRNVESHVTLKCRKADIEHAPSLTSYEEDALTVYLFSGRSILASTVADMVVETRLDMDKKDRS